MKNTKYTDESLQIILDCTTIRQALLKLGLTPDGGHKKLRILIRTFLESKGLYKGKSDRARKYCNLKNNEQFFTNDGTKKTSFSVRNALFKRGIKDKICEKCGNTHWNNNPIPLEVHHIDGDKLNNKLENLQILCPNCHYFTDTYKTKNIKKEG